MSGSSAAKAAPAAAWHLSRCHPANVEAQRDEAVNERQRPVARASVTRMLSSARLVAQKLPAFGLPRLLPDDLNIELGERMIAADERECFDRALRCQHPVEWVSMCGFEAASKHPMAKCDGQVRETMFR